MPLSSRARARFSTALLIIGIVLFVSVVASFALQIYRGEGLRARLRDATPAPTARLALAMTAAPPEPATPAPGVTPTPITIVPAALAATATAPVSPLTTAAPPATPLAAPTAAPVLASSPVRLAIPDLQIDVPVTDATWKVVRTPAGLESEWVIPENAGGYHVNSVRPGEPGNVVISGHNNIFGKVFERISIAWDEDHKQQVDRFTFTSDILNGRTIELEVAGGRRFSYRITEFIRLTEAGVPVEQQRKNLLYIEPTGDDRLTLVTCWPPWSNTYRLIVVAVPAG